MSTISESLRPEPACVAALLRRCLAALVWERRLTDELARELRHYTGTLQDRGSDRSAQIAALRVQIRRAEWRRLCGKLPDHMQPHRHTPQKAA